MTRPQPRWALIWRGLSLAIAGFVSTACGDDRIQLGKSAASSPLTVQSILLHDATSGALIRDLTLSTPLSISALASNQLSLQAVVTGPVVSVEFVVDGKVQVQEVPPFTYPGDTDGKLESFGAVEGGHSVTATPYSKAGAEGERGASRSESFSFVP